MHPICSKVFEYSLELLPMFNWFMATRTHIDYLERQQFAEQLTYIYFGYNRYNYGFLFIFSTKRWQFKCTFSYNVCKVRRENATIYWNNKYFDWFPLLSIVIQSAIFVQVYQTHFWHIGNSDSQEASRIFAIFTVQEWIFSLSITKYYWQTCNRPP